MDIVKSTSFETLRPVLDRIFSTHGIPETLSTDNGPSYLSDGLKGYAREMGFELDPVTPKDPQSNSFAENFVKSLCKLIHASIAENKDPKKELNRFLLHYRATPHLTTGRSPAEMLFNRKIKTKLPTFPHYDESKERKDIRENHDKRKSRQKHYFDKRRRATKKPINVGDKVLVRQEKSTTKPPFNPVPLKVTSVQGNRVTATDGDKIVTRDKNHSKKLHDRPSSVKPSWERGVHFDLGPPATEIRVYERHADTELNGNTHNTVNAGNPTINGEDSNSNGPDTSDDTNNGTDEQTSPVRLTNDMAAHMEHLFAQAEQAMQNRETTGERVVTRSAGRSLRWNQAMNSKDVLVEEDED